MMKELAGLATIYFCLAIILTSCQQQNTSDISPAAGQDNIPSSRNYSQKGKDFVTVDVLNSERIVK
jgi:hypothetical protein